MFDRFGMLLTFLLLIAAPVIVSNTVWAQESPGATTTQSDDGKCDCKDGGCKDGQCSKGKCDDSTETVSVDTASDNDKPTSFTSTHQQSNCFRPEIDGVAANLSTFRLRTDGNLVACVWTNSNRKGKDEENSEVRGFVQIYDPELDLVDQFGLPFQPSALDLDASGNMFIGGEGKISRMNRNGEIEIVTDSPTLAGADMEKLKEEVREDMKKQQERNVKSFESQIETYTEQIEKIEEIEEEERTKSQVRRLKSLKAQVKNYQSYIEQQNEINDEMIEWRLKSKSKITAVAVTENDVFVATGARKGSGYEVYRMTRELEDAECVLKNLRGCCGQMDIHAHNDQIYVAENTKFNVAIYDRDGEEVSRFGQRLRKDNQGFGSCCNPMNVICCPNGDILTAESSIGKIKRFNVDGELTGYVGRARIGGGCKHVAIGFDQERDRYYVQYEDKHQICVLMPKSSVGDTKDPRIAEFTERLTAGKWQLAEADVDASSTEKTAGIGIALKDDGSGNIVIERIFENSPVEKQGRINEGDIVIAAGQAGEAFKDVSGMSPQQVTELIRGNAGVSIRVKYRSPDSKKTRRTKFRRAGMKRVDGQWVFDDEIQPAGFSMESLSKMKSLDFRTDGSVKTEMEVESNFGGMGGSKWLATKVDDETLHIDIESDEDMIMYRVKVKFIDNDSARISVTYDGIGEEGEFRDYKLRPSENDKAEVAGIAADEALEITEIDEK